MDEVLTLVLNSWLAAVPTKAYKVTLLGEQVAGEEG